MKFLWFLVALCLAGFSAPSPASAQKDRLVVLGAWEGESKCMVPDSPCHDEHVIYEIHRAKDSKHDLSIAAYKIVGGERQFMGTLVCRFDAGRAELACSGNTRKHDEWIFQVTGNTMSGRLLIDPNRLLYRKVSLNRIARH